MTFWRRAKCCARRVSKHPSEAFRQAVSDTLHRQPSAKEWVTFSDWLGRHPEAKESADAIATAIRRHGEVDGDSWLEAALGGLA